MLSEADLYELITTCLGSVFSLPPRLATEKGKEEAITDMKEREVMYTDALTALQELLMQILLQDLSPDGLQAVFKHIEPWLSARDHERERATETTSKLLAFYLDKLNIRNMVAFHNLGALIGRVIPRCADPLPTVRRGAVESIYTLLCIQLRYEGFALDHRDEEVEFLRSVKDGLGQAESKVLLRMCSDIGKVISKRMPQDQVNTLLFMLFEGLGDQHPSAAIAAAILINTLVHIRGTGLGDQVRDVLGSTEISVWFGDS
uniref:Maestro-like HEAT-repeats domain-containing protein n=1 Tax=Callorhinchus milii TaxID=7868 RepID=A0A4W3GSE3_CALMI